MLIPNRTKYRKVRKGKLLVLLLVETQYAFGQYALQSLDGERITSRQIEAAQTSYDTIHETRW